MKHSFEKQAFDKNGVEITDSCLVEMPEPNGNDIHNNSFVGTAIDSLDDGTVIVEDSDGDCFAIEANRLVVYDESDNQLSDEQIDRLKRIVDNHLYTPDQE